MVGATGIEPVAPAVSRQCSRLRLLKSLAFSVARIASSCNSFSGFRGQWHREPHWGAIVAGRCGSPLGGVRVLPHLAAAIPEVSLDNLAGSVARGLTSPARLLSVLAELEIAERGRRRIERYLAEARLPPGKTLDNFDFATVPMLSKARYEHRS